MLFLKAHTVYTVSNIVTIQRNTEPKRKIAHAVLQIIKTEKIKTASSDAALDACVSLARRQQDKEAVATVGIVLWSPFSSAQTPQQSNTD